MKIDQNKKVRSVAGENIVIMQGAGTTDMTRVVALNESALELYNRLQGSEFTADDVAQALMDAYDVDAATAAADAAAWIDQMRTQGLILD